MNQLLNYLLLLIIIIFSGCGSTAKLEVDDITKTRGDEKT